MSKTRFSEFFGIPRKSYTNYSVFPSLLEVLWTLWELSHTRLTFGRQRP